MRSIRSLKYLSVSIRQDLRGFLWWSLKRITEERKTFTITHRSEAAMKLKAEQRYKFSYYPHQTDRHRLQILLTSTMLLRSGLVGSLAFALIDQKIVSGTVGGGLLIDPFIIPLLLPLPCPTVWKDSTNQLSGMNSLPWLSSTARTMNLGQGFPRDPPLFVRESIPPSVPDPSVGRNANQYATEATHLTARSGAGFCRWNMMDTPIN
jgi:hypothetical protein